MSAWSLTSGQPCHLGVCSGISVWRKRLTFILGGAGGPEVEENLHCAFRLVLVDVWNQFQGV